MAGKWIKMRSGLDQSIKVFRIAAALNRDASLVVGDLYRLAAWFAEHGHYGKLKADEALLDSFLGVDGFACQLRLVGWLGVHPTVLTLHEFCGVSASRKSLGKKLRNQILSAGKCAACGSSDDLVVDHVIPIVRGGLCEASNLQALCAPCNRSKGKKLPSEWRRS